MSKTQFSWSVPQEPSYPGSGEMIELSKMRSRIQLCVLYISRSTEKERETLWSYRPHVLIALSISDPPFVFPVAEVAGSWHDENPWRLIQTSRGPPGIPWRSRSVSTSLRSSTPLSTLESSMLERFVQGFVQGLTDPKLTTPSTALNATPMGYCDRG